MRRFFKVIGTVLLIGVLSSVIFTGIFMYYLKTAIMDQPISEINLSEIPVNLSSTIWYRDPETGQYARWVQLDSRENRVWVEYSKIPKDFEHAFVAIEDQRFYQHHGVDWKRTAAATLNTFTNGKTFGGSTITQQLIKNLTNDNEVTIKRKVTEICRALKLEEEYDKKVIMEWYMNIIYFGHGQYGIGAASKYYFNKDVSSLSLAEMCSIAGITNNPSKYSPYRYPENNKIRQELILDQMLKQGYINEDECETAKAETLQFAEHDQSQSTKASVYPYYVDAVIDDVIEFFEQNYNITKNQATSMLYYGGYDIYACVDMSLQKKMDAIYQDRDQIPKTRDKTPLQSSMVVIDPYTGDIVGLEGGVGKKSVARGLNWATSPLGRRPPGSSIKPIAVYGPAIEEGLITPNSTFMDAEDVALKGTEWMPHNDNHKHYGPVTIRQAVSRSLNTVAAQVMDKLGPAASFKFLTQDLHMDLEPDDCDYAPLAMGQLSVGTTTREMASAYTIFPSGGVFRQGRTFSEIRDYKGTVICDNKPVTDQAISDKTAYWMTDMLQQAVKSGTGYGARLNKMPAAGKTGTTSDNKDRWFVGYTPYYVGAVWTGYETPAKISVSGNPAAAIWKTVMTSIHEGLEYKDFFKPEDTTLKPVKDDNLVEYTPKHTEDPAPQQPSAPIESDTPDVPIEPDMPITPETSITPDPIDPWGGAGVVTEPWQNKPQNWWDQPVGNESLPEAGENWFDG